MLCDSSLPGQKIQAESIYDINNKKGIFEVEKANGHKYVVNFSKDKTEQMSSCICKDWLWHQLPCKHFFAVFQHRREWQWEQLPSKYLQSAYLAMDIDSIHSHFQQRNEATIGDNYNDTTPNFLDVMGDVVDDVLSRISNISLVQLL